MENFNLYAEYYNLLYKDKNYLKEAEYVEKLFLKSNPNAKTILDLGCGSGRHAYEFYRKGYKVTGVDISEGMLDLAKNLPPNDINFSFGDVRDVNLDQKFDVVVSLFHVLSYQQTNQDVIDFFSTAKKHLNPGGVFICDCWYGPGVLTEMPTVRKKELENENVKITRIAEPEIHFNSNIVDVNYSLIIVDRRTSIASEIKETHRMRYFFQPELELFLINSRLTEGKIFAWEDFEAPTESCWNICLISQY